MFNTATLAVQVALDGVALTWVTVDRVGCHLAAGWLVRVLQDWCPPFSSYRLYYPSRRQHTPAFTLVLDALRYRAESTPQAYLVHFF